MVLDMIYLYAGFAVLATILAIFSTSTFGHVGWAVLAAMNAVAVVVTLRRKRRKEQ